MENEDSWVKYDTINFYSNFDLSSLCDEIKEPFQERISFVNKIGNCMYCESDNSCIICNYGFSLFNGQCLPSNDLEKDSQYYNPVNGTNYYTCASKITNCEKCTHNELLFNKFHCSKCSKGLYLNEIYQCEKNTLKTFLLGFSRFSYIALKTINYFTYVSYVRKKYTPKIIIIKKIYLFFKNIRKLQISETKDSICILVDDDEYENIKKYNCSIETNGEEIEKIEIDKTIEIKDDDLIISDIELSPIAIRQMSNLQNIGDEDYFSKKLYLLDNATTIVDDNKKVFNITGYIEDNDFHYNKLNLEISLLENSDEKLENISCDSIKINENLFTLKCSTNKSITGQLNNCFSYLGDANLIINFLEGEKKNINFGGISKPTTQNTNSDGLSKGAIIGIVISLIVVVIFIIVGLIIFLAIKKKKLLTETISENNKNVISEK